MSAELVIVTPVVIVVLLFVVGLARLAHAGQVADQAALAGARAASLASDEAVMSGRADQSARAALASAGMSCVEVSVGTTMTFVPGGFVTVQVRCVTDLSASVMAGLPGTALVTGQATVPIETYRQVVP